jgi:hypothetical protein
MAYTYFMNGKYTILEVKENEFSYTPIENKIDKKAATLAPLDWKKGRSIVQTNLEKSNLVIKTPSNHLKTLTYKPKFKLDYLANSGMGVSSSRWGTGLGGGIQGLFSDMLNNNLLSGTVALNGQIEDLGGQFFYLNQKSPLQWGASISRVPYRFSDYQVKSEYISDPSIKTSLSVPLTDSLFSASYNLYRLSIYELGAFAFYPLSSNKRIEVGTSANWYTYSGQTYTDYYAEKNAQTTYYVTSKTPERISQETLTEKGFSKFNLQQIYVAFVGDNATFGTTAPLNGYRYRFEYSKYFGDIAHNSVTADFRKYKYLKPFTLATRLYYFGRLKALNLNDYNRLYPMNLGYPWHMHGYWGNALNKQLQSLQLSDSQLQGTQMGLANFEVRLPLTGPKKLALFDFQYVPSDLNFFFDAGMAWNETDKKPGTEYNALFSDGNSKSIKINPILSTGISLRINLLGYLILEPYVALPIYNGQFHTAVTGLNFMVPGW